MKLSVLNLFLLILAFALSSCLGGTKSPKTKASCGLGQVFNALSRNCEGAVIGEVPPSLTLKTVNFLEDPGTQAVSLLYTDYNSDPATACTASSSKLGLIKNLSFNSITYTTNSDVEKYVQFRYVDTGALSVTVTPSGNYEYITVNIDDGVTLASAIIAAINGDGDNDCTDGDASCLVTASLTGADAAESENLTFQEINQMTCSCAAGICTAQVTPTDHYNSVLDGDTFFQYTLTDNDGTSDPATVAVTISSVNDVPTASVGDFTIEEDYSNSYVYPTLDLQTLSVAAPLLAATAVTVDDSADHTLNSALIFSKVSDPANGTLTLNADGTFVYTPTAEYSGGDTFTYKVTDPDSADSTTETITITVNNLEDVPVNTMASLSDFNEDTKASGGTDIVTLSYTDAEGDDAETCGIDAVSKVYISTACSCTGAGVCTVGVTAYPNATGAATFDYHVDDTDKGNSSVSSSVSFNLTAVNDGPFAFPIIDAASANRGANGNVEFAESNSHIPNAITFTLATATDVDDTVSSYEIVDSPANGTLVDCMDLTGSTGSTDLTCTYTPKDGNINNGGGGTQATGDFPGAGEVTFTANTYGIFGNTLTVEFVNADNLTGGGDEYAWVEDGINIRILMKTGVSTQADIVTAVAASTEASALVTAIAGTPANTVTLMAQANLAGGTDTADYFTYKVKDASGTYSATSTIAISITPTDDFPMVCGYSSYGDAPECGLAGCIGNDTPIGNITPSTSGLYYYDSSSSACWKSNTAVTDLWELTANYIPNQTINEQSTVIIDKIKIDEGGGDAAENAQGMSISAASSSDGTLIPTTNIDVYYNGALVGNLGALPLAIGDGAASADASDFKIVITPAGGQFGSSTISLTFSDGTNTDAVNFSVTVNNSSAQHGGWANISAVGPKVNKFSQVKEDRYVCNYSRALCESGSECKGSGSPVGNSNMDPDDIDSIYFDSTNSTCYRVDYDSVDVDIQNITYVSRKPSGASITYTSGGTAGSESVSVSGTDITIQIDDGVSTANQIITALLADSEASKLVEAKTSSGATAQSTNALTAIGTFDNSNWIPLQSYCNISPSDFEASCAVTGTTCMGEGDANTVIGQASSLDSYYYDITNDVCYRSVEVDGGGDDWATYNATGETTLDWLTFTVSGTASISEYRVYRRLAGDSFDYDSPINRETISSTTTAYTDNYANSYYAPVPGTVYYYEVRPVLNSIATDTSQVFKTARVMVPPDNMSFVHQWIANQEICELMQATPDPSNNFRCVYDGPGGDSTLAPGSNFYDIGQDLLVDRFEAGCNYSASPICDTPDGSCIDMGTPNAVVTAAINSIYYDRSSGICYINTDGATAWSQYTGATAMAGYSRAELPPLVHISQTQSDTFCSGATSISNVLGYTGAISKQLPSRKQQIAYSIWDDDANTDSDITNLEIGLSINSSSKCNSSTANGVSGNYSDVQIPDSNSFYTLPGSATSSIRSLMTGSSLTESCVSRFGIQDHVGNVNEWTTDRIVCPSPYICTSVLNGDPEALASTTNDFRNGDGSDTDFVQYALNGIIGPCIDADADSVCDTSLGTWTIQDEYYDGGRFIVPMGLIADVDFPSDFPASDAGDFMLEIGPSSGISTDKLHYDTVAIYSQAQYGETNNCGAMATGGGYTDGTGGGVWTQKIFPCTDVNGYLVFNNSDSVYYVVSNSTSLTPSLTLTDPAAINQVLSLSANTSTGVVNVNLDTDGAGVITTTPAALVAAINGDGDGDCSDGDASCLITISTLTLGVNPVVAMSNTTLDTTHAKASQVDVGFRCIAPVNSGNYGN